MKVTMMLIVIGELGTIPKSLVRELEVFKIKGTNRDYPNPNIAKIGQNTEKCPVDKQTCCLSDSSEIPTTNAGMKNLRGVM